MGQINQFPTCLAEDHIQEKAEVHCVEEDARGGAEWYQMVPREDVCRAAKSDRQPPNWSLCVTLTEEDACGKGAFTEQGLESDPDA